MSFDGRLILAAARRFVTVLAVVGCGTAVVSALVALVTSTSLDRAISLGMYGVGSFCVIGGFAIGTRGPLRRPVRGEQRAPRGHVASVDDLRGARNASGLLITVGLLLLVIGVVVDSRFKAA